MNDLQILVEKTTTRIEAIIEIYGVEYEEAKAIYKRESGAGVAVWEIVDAKFAN